MDICTHVRILYQFTPCFSVFLQFSPFWQSNPSFLLTWRSCFFCSWCEYTSTLVPGLLSTVLPLLLRPPQGTQQIKLHIYVHRRHQQHQHHKLSALITLKSYNYAKNSSSQIKPRYFTDKKNNAHLCMKAQTQILVILDNLFFCTFAFLLIGLQHFPKSLRTYPDQ